MKFILKFIRKMFAINIYILLIFMIYIMLTHNVRLQKTINFLLLLINRLRRLQIYDLLVPNHNL